MESCCIRLPSEVVIYLCVCSVKDIFSPLANVRMAFEEPASLLEKNDANQLDGTIAAGKKMNGVIGYEVPADWKTIEIHFKDNVWSSNKFKFEIIK